MLISPLVSVVVRDLDIEGVSINEPKADPPSVVEFPEIGGLQHHYQRAAPLKRQGISQHNLQMMSIMGIGVRKADLSPMTRVIPYGAVPPGAAPDRTMAPGARRGGRASDVCRDP
jgi:hypothetical protein